MIDLNSRIERLYPELVAIRRDFHSHPELGEKEFYTSEKIHEYLERWGISHETGIADTGVVGIIYGKKSDSDSKTVALRADMDALPITEHASSPYASQTPGIMHACGHDAHMTIQLGAAKILKEMEDILPGNIKLLFQPAEETIGGARRMVTAGCMKHPKVDYVIGLHMTPVYETGHVELKYGKLNASSDHITIEIYGKSAHGAYPENGIDAIVIAASVISALQSLVSRNISPLNHAVLSFGTIEGGKAGNIICDHVTLHGTLRTTDKQTRDFAIETIKRQAKHISIGYGGNAEVSIHSGYEALINCEEIVTVIADTAKRVFGESCLRYKEFPSLGVEDFSFFLEEAKGAFYHLGCGNIEKGIQSPLHSNTFDIDEECLKIGVRLQLEIVLALLNF